MEKNGPEKEGIRNFLRDLFIYDGVEVDSILARRYVYFCKEFNGPSEL